jgi:ferric-dicitrate binding protein FerR (iron transport regulator)
VLYGEAYFTIVADPHRPFTVDVASAHLSAAPGTLRVRNLQDARSIFWSIRAARC